MDVKVTSVSSKGQVVIPNDIRKKLKLAEGTNLLVFTDGSNLLLKPIHAPKLKTFENLIKESREIAKQKKMKKVDVEKLIKKVRNESRS